jgi:hypothetical protein
MVSLKEAIQKIVNRELDEFSPQIITNNPTYRDYRKPGIYIPRHGDVFIYVGRAFDLAPRVWNQLDAWGCDLRWKFSYKNEKVKWKEFITPWTVQLLTIDETFTTDQLDGLERQLIRALEPIANILGANQDRLPIINRRLLEYKRNRGNSHS